MKLELIKGKVFWHYVVRASNGQVVVTSETYYSKGNAVRAAKKAAKALGLSLASS